MTVFAPFRNAFSSYRDRDALIEGRRKWTFSRLGQVVEAVAGALHERMSPGDRVGLFMRNCAEYTILQLALERAGLVRVPLNARYTAWEVERIIEDCGAQAVFFDASTADRLCGLTGQGVWLCQVDGDESNSGPRWEDLLAFDGPGAPELSDYEALCSINYTSGSSGTPKGVMLTCRNWQSVTRNMLIDRDIRSSDRLAHIGPLSHASGTYFTPFLLRGATNVIVPDGSLDALLPTIEMHRVTAFSCVPTVLTRILNSNDIDRYDLSTVRWIGYGAESIQRNTLEKALERWGNVLTHNYGLTEAMMTCTFLRPDEHWAQREPGVREVRFGCIGRPYSYVDVVLRNQQGEQVGDGEIGEITIQAEHVMKGYWKRPDETRKILRDGWLWSGDLARRDSEGYLYIVGRSKEMLISGGFNIYPAEVEACLSSCPGVEEAAVIGLPDEAFGEIAVAFVSAERGAALTRETCEHFCKSRIGIRTPKQWHFVDRLPRTGNGKVDKAALKSRLQTDRDIPA